jgi:hypothetical protein
MPTSFDVDFPPAGVWRWPEEYAHCLEDLRKTGWRE